MANPLISVIVPVYNVSKYLRKCLDSIINQTYKNLEIILIDDGSTDESPKICDEYAQKDKRIKVIHKQNEGVSIARNTALDIAKGEYVGFVDSDDYIKSDMYETLYNKLKAENAKLVVCNWFLLRENECIENTDIPQREILTPNEALESFYRYMYLWNKLFHRDIIKGLYLPTNCGFGEDILFCLEAYKNAKRIVYIKDAKYYYLQNPNSALNSHKVKKIYLEYLKVLDKEMAYAKEQKLYDLKSKIYNNQLHTATAWLGFIALSKNQDREMIKELLNYVKRNYFNFIISKEKLSKKLFITLCCVNFNLASKICQKIGKFK